MVADPAQRSGGLDACLDEVIRPGGVNVFVEQYRFPEGVDGLVVDESLRGVRALGAVHWFDFESEGDLGADVVFVGFEFRSAP